MSIFDSLDRMTSRAVDRAMAIPFRFIPMRSSPNGRPQPDHSRLPVDGLGVVDESPATHAVEIGDRDRTGNNLRSVVTGQTHELSIDRNHFDKLAWEPRQGGRIEIDCRTYRVLEVRRDGLSRMALVLGSRG